MPASSAHPAARTACRPSDIDTYLSEAHELVRGRGQKLTPIRRKVLQLLAKSDQPSKAYDLLEKLDGEGSAKPPTVYRALEFLLDMGLAHKIESLNAYVACGHASHRHTAVFLICDTCGLAQELHSETSEKALKSDVAAVGFKLNRAVIEARGNCETCRT